LGGSLGSEFVDEGFERVVAGDTGGEGRREWRMKIET
jgi:hypothetical protein